ncbi:MAG: M56 family metallopeptidase [Weeksellaceae bacterium]
MEVLLIYLFKSVLISVVFWGYYKLFLEGKEFHHYNRFYLLIAVVLSSVLPIVRVDWFTIQSNNDRLSTFLRYINGNGLIQSTETSEISWMPYVGVFIAGVSVILLGKVGYGIYRIILLKSRYPKEKHEHYTMVLTDLSTAPFTFLKNLFWNNSIDINTPSGEKILKHELAHIEEKHTIDRLFLQLVKATFWFNPIYYLFYHEIILIHEYLADQKAIKNKDSSAFAAMLLSQHYHKTALSGTSPFFNSTIKKRLVMLKKNHNTKFSYARRVLALPLIFTISMVYMVQAKNKEIEANNEAIEAFVVEEVNQINDTIKEKKVIKVESSYIESDSDEVIKENFSLEYSNKDGFKSNIDEDVDIYLDGKKITQEEMNALNPGSIKDIKTKKGAKHEIHIETIENSTNASHDKTMITTATFVEDDQNVAEGKNTYYLENKEITEEELKEDYPEVYENAKNKSGKFISVSPKVITIQDKDGTEVKLNNYGKNNLSDEKLEIYLDGKRISEKELFKINQQNIKEMKINKQKKRIDVYLE